jgi:predicted RNA binding protein YcfA (HicA-like mRNA interferase family)
MPKLKLLSGYEVIKFFEKSGFGIVTQKGSHIKIRRNVNGQKETLIIPNHKQLDTGTLRAIIKQASKYIPFEELKIYFYSE